MDVDVWLCLQTGSVSRCWHVAHALYTASSIQLPTGRVSSAYAPPKQPTKRVPLRNSATRDSRLRIRIRHMCARKMLCQKLYPNPTRSRAMPPSPSTSQDPISSDSIPNSNSQLGTCAQLVPISLGPRTFTVACESFCLHLVSAYKYEYSHTNKQGIYLGRLGWVDIGKTYA